MKNSLLTMALAIIVAAGAQSPLSAKTDEKDTKTEKADTTAKKPAVKKTPYERLTKDFKVSAKGEFMTLHKTSKDKVYIEYPMSNLGRRILAGSTVRTVSDPSSINVGYKYSDPQCLTIELEDSLVVLSLPQISASSSDPQMAKAMERNYTPRIYKRLSVAAFSPDSSTFLFDATGLINGLAPKSKEFSATKGDDRSTWFGEIKAFDDNASIVINNNMEISRSLLGIKFVTGSGSMSSTVSFLLLPEDLMKPRIQDSRVGIFSTGGNGSAARYEISTQEDGFRSYRIANRWRVEPSDTTAWKNGELVSAKNPILWYVDDAFPEAWKEPIRKAILDWNIAFEKIGLKDVMAVKDFPTAEEDPEFDPDNLKYTCIRYIPNATMNAMGPSWVDPVTGEILNACVLVYNDVIRLINNWRFVQTAQIDERVRSKKLPQDVVEESLEYVVAHEIGHTLGLMHNMSASSTFPVDSLRSATFTQKYGTTPSIMDYARFNYVAQPGDKGVKLTPPTLGIYDEYAIGWLYRPFPDAKDMWEESREAEKIVNEKASDPRYAYGAQQINSSGYGEYDPSARSEDLGNDPVKAGEYGISNLKYILPNLNTWIQDDPDRSHRQQLYTQMANQFNRYVNNVLSQVGGIYLRQVRDGDQGEPVSVVPAKTQKQSLKWAVDQVRNAGWLDDQEVTGKFDIHAPISNKIAQTAATSLTQDTPERVVLACSLSNEKDAYSLSDYYSDLYDELFNGGKLTSTMKTLQRSIVAATAKPVTALRNKTSLTDEPEFHCYEDECGCEDEQSFGESHAPYQKSIDISNIDDTLGCRNIFLRKVAKMAKNRRRTASGEDKAHYEYLYRTARAAFGK